MGRSKTQNQQIKDLRRETILSCALNLFATNGLAATKITDIAAAAHISHGLLYHYYRSKEELYTDLIRIAFEKLNTACRELERHPASPREKLIMALEALLTGFSSHEDTARYHLLIAQASIADDTPEEAREIILAQRTLPYEILARIIADGQKNGSIKPYPPKDLAMVFWTIIKGLALHKAVWGEEYHTPDMGILKAIFLTDSTH